ncbi:MAG: two-component regulator propeller domain-containing protein [Saprospiraceae bacterium]
MRKKIIILFLFWNCLNANAQVRQIIFDQVPIDQELTAGVVLSITQDSLGFIWIGTFEGLVRYDGYEFKRIPSGGKSAFAISSDRTFDLFQGSNQKLWIGTIEGLNCIDLKTATVEKYIERDLLDKQNNENKVNCILEDSKGRLWFNNQSGLQRFDKTAKKATALTQSNAVGRKNVNSEISSIIEARNGQVWAGTNSGLLKINPENNTYSKIFTSKDTSKPENQKIRTIFFSKNETLWIGTVNGLVQSVDGGNHFENVKLPIQDLNISQINAIIEDDEGYLWIGFSQKGLLRWHPTTGIFQHFKYSSINTNSIISNNIQVLFKDKSNNIWIGTNKGVNKINIQVHQFQFYQNQPEIRQMDAANSIERVYYDKINGLWATSISSILKNDVLGQLFKRNTNFHDTIFIEAFQKDINNRLWMAGMQIFGKSTTGGLFYYNKKMDRIERAKGDKRTTYTKMHDVKLDIRNNNYLWLSTVAGLCHYNIKTADTAWFYPSSSVKNADNWSQKMHETKDGHIWFASLGNGLGHLNVNTGAFEYFRHNSDNENSIVSDFVRNITSTGNDSLWIATNTGLSCFDTRSRNFTNFTLDNGLKGGNMVYDVISDKKGRIWFTTNHYISCYNPQSKVFNYYNKAHGFTTNFNRASMYLDENGLLYVGGTNGLVVCNTNEIRQYRAVPNVVLTEFSVKNKNYPLPQTIENTRRILLNYDDNIFSFQFAALEFINNSNIDYAYKMEGFDKEWTYSGKNRKATYTNLNPGEYTFLVKSTNFDNVWAEASTLSITVIIAPPFWQTSWFLSLMALLSIAFIYLIFQIRKHQQKLRYDKEIAEQSARYKSLFLANMSHEIRTPMNAIVGLSRLLSEMSFDKKAKDYIDAIKSSAENLLRIINDILDYSKIESGKFVFLVRPFEIHVLLDQIKNTLHHKLEEKGLVLNISIAADIPKLLNGDAARLNQILINLIGNAIKFTKSGLIDVNIETIDKIKDDQVQIQFTVKDTGIGIAPEYISRIFDSFDQGDEEVYSIYGGTGLGLSITKHLVEHQGGHIYVNSELNKGTIFTFSLPFTISHTALIAQKEYNTEHLPQNISVLIVDDTFFNQMLASEILKKYIKDVIIDVADNGQIALEKILEKSFDLILMDVKMPVMGGFEATQLIRKMPEPKCNTPIIALTANAVAEQLDECKQIGMDDAISKPIDSNQLLLKIKQYVKFVALPGEDEQ